MGLVSRVVRDLQSETESLLKDLRARDPEVLKASKRYFASVRKLAPEARSAYALVEQTRFAERRKH
jgi:hypothetical protein